MRRMLVIGVDAAWTSFQPSGVALVEKTAPARWRCLALAPSYPTFLGALAGASDRLERWPPQNRGWL